MKSTVLKKKDSTHIRQYAALFGLLFLGALLMFVEHFYEDAVTPSDLEGLEPRREVRSEPGYHAPPFTARALDGRRVSLADYKGQVVVLNLWATWCAPCRVEMPGIESLYRRFRSEGLTVLAVSLDKGEAQGVRDFVREYGLSFPVLLDPESQVESRYQTLTIPTTFVIDRQGVIAARVDGAKNWESRETFEAIEFLLKMPAPPSARGVPS